jgi:hypothetical protein
MPYRGPTRLGCCSLCGLPVRLTTHICGEADRMNILGVGTTGFGAFISCISLPANAQLNLSSLIVVDLLCDCGAHKARYDQCYHALRICQCPVLLPLLSLSHS